MLRSVKLGPSFSAAVERLPLDPLRTALEGVDHYLVGGVVRDLLLGKGTGADIDLAIDGDLELIMSRLEPTIPFEVEASHQRFGTATVLLGGLSVDFARTRVEFYPAPGALPEVAPAGIEQDLARRDFTVNAMAIQLNGPFELLDPWGGAGDIEAGQLRVLHERSFSDDPTRALRAARYAARLGFEPEAGTLELLRRADLGTISEDRRGRELLLIAAEARASDALGLLAAWGLLELPEGFGEMIAAIDRLAAEDGWRARARTEAILIVADDGPGLDRARCLAAAEPGRPSEAVALASGVEPAELLVAAAAGASWVENYADTWSEVRLEIDGEDLIAAGIPEGKAIGTGLRGALERRLDGELSPGREAELEAALAIARAEI